MSSITLKIITDYDQIKNVKKSCIIIINTERSVEELEDVVLSALFPNNPKFYRVQEWFNNSTRSKIVFEGAEKISDLGIQNSSALMVSIVRGRESRKCVPNTTEGVRLCLAADKRDKAEEKKAQKQAAQKVANGNASKKLKAAGMPGDGIRLGDGEVIRASKKKRSVQKSHPEAADDVTDLEDTILGSVRAANAIDLNDGDIGDLTKGHWRGKMQDTLDEQILLGTDQMQLDCIKTGDYIIEKVENVNVSGRIDGELDMKLFKVICKPVGEAKILSTKRSAELHYFLDVNGTKGRQLVESAFERASETGEWNLFHPNKMMVDSPDLIWGMVLKCNMEKGTSDSHPWGEFHSWSYIELLQTFAPRLDWSVLLNSSIVGEQRLRHREPVHYDA
jgi:hypothetical protein